MAAIGGGESRVRDEPCLRTRRRRATRPSTSRRAKGVRLVQGQWRYSDTKIVEVDFTGPGDDNQPTGAPVRTYDYTPHAGVAGFDDSAWPVIDPLDLVGRRGHGRLSFNWYRIGVTIPERIGAYDPTGATVELETSLDDYAEIWVDGELPRVQGQMGGSVVSGWNAPNRLVIGRDVRPGQRIQLAVFGINGPISNPPTNFIWVRYARLHFREGPTGPMAVEPQEVNVEVVRAQPGDRGDRRREPEAVQGRRGLCVHRRSGLSAARTGRCSSAIRIATRSIAMRRTAR